MYIYIYTYICIKITGEVDNIKQQRCDLNAPKGGTCAQLTVACGQDMSTTRPCTSYIEVLHLLRFAQGMFKVA